MRNEPTGSNPSGLGGRSRASGHHPLQCRECAPWTPPDAGSLLRARCIDSSL